MEYSDFIANVGLMLSKFDGGKLLVPTLGGKSLFLVYVAEGKLNIVNSGGKTYAFKAAEYNAIRDRFLKSPAFVAFKTCNYTRTDDKARCIGWTNGNGNQNEIYWGYLPAVFRELYARNKILVGNTEAYGSLDANSYKPVDWSAFAATIKIDDIINSISSSQLKLKVAPASFLEAKNKVCSFLTGSNWDMLCTVWSDVANTVKDEALRSIILIILELIRAKIIECFKAWEKGRKNKYSHRNCKKCPRNK